MGPKIAIMKILLNMKDYSAMKSPTQGITCFRQSIPHMREANAKLRALKPEKKIPHVTWRSSFQYLCCILDKFITW